MISLEQDILNSLQKKYFGKPDLSDMIHGMSEEIGEFNHWFLKAKQGIVSDSQARLEMADAFGDTVIFGIQAMSCLNLDAELVLKKVLHQVINRNWKKRNDYKSI